MLAISMGFLVNGLSVFFLPLEAEFSASRADVALINTFGLVGIALGGIIVGTVADRADICIIAIVAALCIGGTTIAAARATTLWQLYLLFFFAGLLGGGALFAPVIAVVGSWFRTIAGLAIGIASAGQGLGQGGVPLGASFLIENLGWRDAMATDWIHHPRNAPAARVPDAPAASTSGCCHCHFQRAAAPASDATMVVVAMSVAVLCCCAGMSVPLMHLVPLIQGCGIAAPEAGSVLFTLMISAICGRIAFGQLADMIGAIPAYMTAVAWQTLLMYGFTQFRGALRLFISMPRSTVLATAA